MRSIRDFRRAAPLACALLPLALGACSSIGSGEGAGSTLQNFILYGGATVPPAQAVPPLEVLDCPPVTVTEGGAAIRAVAGGDAASVRNQISIANVARECMGREDGAINLKVGVQVRALLGPGGSGGRFDTPVSFVVKRGDQVILSRSRRVNIAIPAGQFEQSGIVVEEGMVVPAGLGEFDIEVGLGSGGRSATARSRRTRS